MFWVFSLSVLFFLCARIAPWELKGSMSQEFPAFVQHIQVSGCKTRPASPLFVCAKIELASETSNLSLDLALYLTDTGVFYLYHLLPYNAIGFILATSYHPARSMLILKLLHQPNLHGYQLKKTGNRYFLYVKHLTEYAPCFPSMF